MRIPAHGTEFFFPFLAVVEMSCWSESGPAIAGNAAARPCLTPGFGEQTHPKVSRQTRAYKGTPAPKTSRASNECPYPTSHKISTVLLLCARLSPPERLKTFLENAWRVKTERRRVLQCLPQRDRDRESNEFVCRRGGGGVKLMMVGMRDVGHVSLELQDVLGK